MGIRISWSGQYLRIRPQDFATAKGRCETKWIKELNLFRIAVYELNSRA